MTLLFVFFFNDTATTEIYTLSLHDALPISDMQAAGHSRRTGERGAWRTMGGGSAGRAERRRATRTVGGMVCTAGMRGRFREDRKSTRLNSSHANISYAVFCLKKKKNNAPSE